MATDYPTAVDGAGTLPNPSVVNNTDSPSLADGQSNQNDAIKALETKLGTGASTPANNTFLIGNGSGSSAYSSLTSAQLASRLTDETGSGSAVFATSPTLTAPAVDTVNESTPANGVTVDGLNLKDGKLNTNNSVVTANITDGAVTAAKVLTGTQLVDRLKNPYKFSAYRNAAANAGNATFALVVLDTELFDTGSNFSTSTGLFTAPIAGFYQFMWQVGTNAGTTRIISALAKNSTTVEYVRGTDLTISSATSGSAGSAFIQLALNDTIGLLAFSASGATGLAVGTGNQTYLMGYLVSAT